MDATESAESIGCTAFHTVRTGETGWSVATRELGLPLWHDNDRVDYSGLTGAVRPRE